MKKANLKKSYLKLLFILLICTLLAVSIPSLEYALTSENAFSISHGFNKMLTAAGISNPHQDKFTVYMDENCKKIDSSIANYRTYYGIGETVHIKVTFTSDIDRVEEGTKLVLKFEDGPEREVTEFEKGSDYLDFKYKLQEGDNGGLTFKNLTGAVFGSDNYKMEIALPSDANIYDNKIIADTKIPEINNVDDMGVYANKIISNETLYTIKDNVICSLTESDIKLVIENGYVKTGDKTSEDGKITFENNRKVINISNNHGAIKTVCINAVDLAGNPIPVHFNVDLSTNVEPLVCVLDGDGNLVTDHKYKIGDTIRIKAFIGEKSNIKVQFGNGEIRQAEKTTNAPIYEYTVQNGDNRIMKVIVDGKCNCEQYFANSANSKTFDSIIADTIAPTVTDYEITLKSTQGYNQIVDSEGVVQRFYNNENILSYKEGTIYIKENIRPSIKYTFSEEVDAKTMKTQVYLGENELYNHDSGHENQNEGGYKEILECYNDRDDNGNGIIDVVDGINNVENGKEAEYKYYLKGIKDLAGNSGGYTNDDGSFIEYTDGKPLSNNKVRLIVDKKGPEIGEIENSGIENGKIKFKIPITETGCGVDVNTINKEAIQVVNANYEVSHEKEDNKLNTVYAVIDVLPYFNDVEIKINKDKIKDLLGNTGTANAETNKVIDVAAPEITYVSGIPTNWVKKTTLSVIANDKGSSAGALKYKFMKKDKSETEYYIKDYSDNNTFEVSENCTVIISVKDSSGNETTKEVVIDKIDTIVPKINDVTVSQISDSAVQVTINAYDDESGVAQYSFDGGATWQSTPTKIYSDLKEPIEIKQTNIQVKDMVGNGNDYHDKEIEIKDTIPPKIHAIIGVPTDWVRETDLIVIASDVGSGIAQNAKSYCFGGIYEDQNYKQITYNDEIEITVKDANENIAKTTVRINKIDRIAPEIIGVDINQVSEYATEVTVKAKDEESGVKEYSFDGGESWQTSPTKTYTSATTIKSIKVKDAVGNVGESHEFIDVPIMGQKPTVSIENNGGTFVKPTDSDKAKVSINITATAGNDCTIFYAVSDSKTDEPGNFENVNSNRLEANLELPVGEYYLWTYAMTVDSNGQNIISNKYVSNVFNIINSGITLEPSEPNKNGDVIVNITYGEGLTENRYAGFGDSRESGLTSVTATENGTVYAEATDKAGNKVYNSIEIKNIDKKAPIVSVEAMQQDKKIEAKISIEEENLAEVQYTWTRDENEPTTWENTLTDEEIANQKISKDITESDEGTWYLYVKATDKAGNTTIAKTDEIIVNFEITYDATSAGTCIDGIKSHDGMTYIIVQPGSTKENLLKYIDAIYPVEVKSSDESTVVTDTLATNQVIELAGKTRAIISVKGDVTADGKINLSDILKLNLFRLGKLNPTYSEFLASNVCNIDNEINFQDVLKLNQYRLKKISTL